MNKFLLPKINLAKNEKIIKIVRSSPIILWPKFLIIIFFISLPFFFLYPLMQKEVLGISIFIGLLLIGVAYAFFTFLFWHYNAWIITNYKIYDINQLKIFERIISEIIYEDIKNITYRKSGLVPMIFKLGEVEIMLSNAKILFVIFDIKHPEKIQQLISSLREEKIKNDILGNNASTNNLINILQKIKKYLGEEKFRQIIES